MWFLMYQCLCVKKDCKRRSEHKIFQNTGLCENGATIFFYALWLIIWECKILNNVAAKRSYSPCRYVHFRTQEQLCYDLQNGFAEIAPAVFAQTGSDFAYTKKLTTFDNAFLQ